MPSLWGTSVNFRYTVADTDDDDEHDIGNEDATEHVDEDVHDEDDGNDDDDDDDDNEDSDDADNDVHGRRDG